MLVDFPADGHTWSTTRYTAPQKIQTPPSFASCSCMSYYVPTTKAWLFEFDEVSPYRRIIVQGTFDLTALTSEGEQPSCPKIKRVIHE